MKLRVAATVLNLRSAPNANSRVIGQAVKGLEVESVDTGPWRYVRLESGTEGWVHGDYLTEAKDETPVPTVAFPVQYSKARINWNDLREPRIGIMLHYDASTGGDGSALAWFSDPACKVSYNILVGDDGKAWSIAPEDKRAWHAGACIPSDSPRLHYKDANSAFYGVSWAGGGKSRDRCPEAAVASIAAQCARLFRKHGWKASETWRIVGHRTEAWARGRKQDPEGPKPTNPILSTAEVRKRVAALLS